MSSFVIQLINWGVLAVIVIGFPAISSLRIGNLQLTSTPVFQLLTLWGFVLAAGANLVTGFFLARRRKLRRVCYTWAFVHGGFLVFEYLVFEGVIDFEWLKQSLLWLREQFGAFTSEVPEASLDVAAAGPSPAQEGAPCPSARRTQEILSLV